LWRRNTAGLSGIKRVVAFREYSVFMDVTTADRTDPLGALMCLAQAGDTSAYDHLLRQCAELARRTLKRRYPFLAEPDAEDLVQDILLSVHSVRATYDGDRPFIPWLMAIVRNRTADMARRYTRRSASEVAVAEYPETFDETQTNMTDEVYGDPEALRQALGKLPKGQRTAIELLKLREMSLKEASKASGMSISALKVATHRATHALRMTLLPRDGYGH
jgi:RNA polymerase sigma factor (sigma-70 family)